MAARIHPGRRFVRVRDVTDESTRLVAVERLRPVRHPRPAYAVFRRYRQLVEQGTLAAHDRRVWLEDDALREEARSVLSIALAGRERERLRHRAGVG